MGHDGRRRGLRSPCAQIESVDGESAIAQAVTSVLNLITGKNDAQLSLSAGELFDQHQHLAPNGTTARSVAGEPDSTLPTVDVTLRVNGAEHQLTLDTRVTLLDALRERLGLTGTKKGCNHGQCGACTVLVNGERINSCLALAALHDGDEITTIEGLIQGSEFHPMQEAFINHDAFQCGYCTPGQICSAVGMLREATAGAVSAVTASVAATTEKVELTDDEIRERMSGNICRCGAYAGILAAIREVRDRGEIAAQEQPVETGSSVQPDG